MTFSSKYAISRKQKKKILRASLTPWCQLQPCGFWHVSLHVLQHHDLGKIWARKNPVWGKKKLSEGHQCILNPLLHVKFLVFPLCDLCILHFWPNPAFQVGGLCKVRVLDCHPS